MFVRGQNQHDRIHRWSGLLEAKEAIPELKLALRFIAEK
jgi:hypothetical protein